MNNNQIVPKVPKIVGNVIYTEYSWNEILLTNKIVIFYYYLIDIITARAVNGIITAGAKLNFTKFK